MGFSELLSSGLSGLGRGLREASGGKIARGYQEAQLGLSQPSDLASLQERLHPEVGIGIRQNLSRIQRQADEAAAGVKNGPSSPYNRYSPYSPYSY